MARLLIACLTLRLAMNAMMDDVELPHCQDEQIKIWVGNGIPKLVERALLYVSNVEVVQQEALSRFEIHYQHYLNSASCLYEGVAETLQTLKNKGYQTALVTNKAEQFLPELLNHFNISDCFDLVIGGDTLVKINLIQCKLTLLYHIFLCKKHKP